MKCPHCGRNIHDLTPEQVIERYYRSRAAGARTTLRQLAKDTGFSYGYLRTMKVRYDHAGKWGSKQHAKP